mmetsp:Transcript_22325/g.37348  ORF Transcript_22325/g.37348 Transcript_22325/m.37348 type:complete len:286 (-) Transcript_22325:1447-2304(-)
MDDRSAIKAQLSTLKRRVSGGRRPSLSGDKSSTISGTVPAKAIDVSEGEGENRDDAANDGTVLQFLERKDNNIDKPVGDCSMKMNSVGTVEDVNASTSSTSSATPDTTTGNPTEMLVDAPSKVSSTGQAVPVIRWTCNECSNECIPIMRESRCLCGHRMKEHKFATNKRNEPVFPCASRNCKCAHFFFLVAEGSWILRCRCKHKHTDHDCAPGSHPCNKCKGSSVCTGFDSPWVCNCGHGWGSHTQLCFMMTDGMIDAEVAAIKAGNPMKKTHYLRQDGVPENEK